MEGSTSGSAPGTSPSPEVGVVKIMVETREKTRIIFGGLEGICMQKNIYVYILYIYILIMIYVVIPMCFFQC